MRFRVTPASHAATCLDQKYREFRSPAWVDAQDVLVLLIGDFDIPVAPDSSEGNRGSPAFTTLTETMTWLRPVNPASTFCPGDFDTMLDHAFLKPGPGISTVEASVLRTDAGYCELDAEGYPDHRPMLATVELGE